MDGSVKSSAAKPATGRDASSGLDLVLKVAGAVGTGIGILGFVTLFGGAILWLRADQAELPANNAVSAIPRSLLVTTGASFLVPAVLIALLAVTVIFAVNVVANLPRQKSAKTASADAETLRGQLATLREDAKRKAEEAKLARALIPDASSDDAAALLADAQRKGTAEIEAMGAVEAKRIAATKMEQVAKGRLTQTPLQFRVELWVGFLTVLALAPLLNKAIFSVDFFWSGLILLLVALVGAAACAVTYLSTEKLIWFGVAAFVTVGIYIGFATYYSTRGNPKVEPAAALRVDRPPVIGSFIADTSDNLYLGTFPDGDEVTRLMVVPRAQVTDLAIGPLTDPDTAPADAVRLALRQCAQVIQVSEVKDSPPVPRPACSAAEKALLHASLTAQTQP